MSAKWHRSKEWDRQHLVGVLAPVRWVLTAFSSITLAVVLMLMLALFGVMASVPVGLIAAIPTWTFYGATLVLAVLIGAGVPVWLLNKGLRSAGAGGALRVAIGTLALIGLLAASAAVWHSYVWPQIHYNKLTGEGVRFFGEFSDRYWSVTVRRLPGLEMSELEFYAWWPLTTILYLFVANMIIATMRRIEFSFVNIGVLTVHTGIVVLAMGGVYYSVAKQEGDVILIAGSPDPATGLPRPGVPIDRFYDNTRTVLRVDQGRGWEQRLLMGVPRYNEYNIQAAEAEVGVVPQPPISPGDEGRRLSVLLPAPDYGSAAGGKASLPIDPDLSFRLVGYVPVASMETAWRPVPAAERAAWGGPSAVQPVRWIDVVERRTTDGRSVVQPGSTEAGVEKVSEVLTLRANRPGERVGQLYQGLMAVEYTRGMDPKRWADLSSPLPDGSAHAIVVEIPAQNLRRVFPVQAGKVFTVGEPAYQIEVLSLSPSLQSPITVPGYQDAASSVAVLKVTPPPGQQSSPFKRTLYHRFPELASDAPIDAGQPSNLAGGRAADSSIRLSYLDASIVQVYIDEPAAAGEGEVAARAIVRVKDRPVHVLTELSSGSRIVLGEPLFLRLGDRMADAERVAVPQVVPVQGRDKEAVGTHRQAAIAVEVSAPDIHGRDWKRVVWLPYRHYEGLNEEEESTVVKLPDGKRAVRLVFGRLWRLLPDMLVRLTDFEMIPYEHSTQPKDYRSDLSVIRGPGVAALRREGAFLGFDNALTRALHAGAVRDDRRSTSLNNPLLESPFVWDDGAPWLRNAVGWLTSGLGPSQYKFSQSGWDSRGWTQTKAEADAGKLPRAYANFTILGVGNNPGIYVIAGGAVLMALGIPWAFYIKPWLLRRRKLKLQRALAAGGLSSGINGRAQAAKPVVQTPVGTS